MADLSAIVMAHPKRAAMVAELRESLDRDVPAIWDERNDLWHTGRRCLLAYDRKATHHLVIQEDAIPCRDLLAGVERACEHSGDHPISLYAGMYKPRSKAGAVGREINGAKGRMARAIQRGEDSAKQYGTPWLEYEGPWWGVALVLPTAHIPDLVEWGDAWTRRRNYDARIGQFYIHSRGIRCWYTMPSLVDHRTPGDDNPSLLGNDIHVATETGRVAHWFIGRDASALDIDWSQLPPSLRRVTFRHKRTGHVRRVRGDTAQYRSLTKKPDWIQEAA